MALSRVTNVLAVLGGAPPPPPSTTKTLLTPADIRYLGSYDLTAFPNTSQGLTHRYVNGDLRFLTGGNVLREFSLAGKSFGQTVSTLTRTWQGIGGFDQGGDYRGLWWEEAKQRLWSVGASSYTAIVVPTQIYTRKLNDDGTIAQLHGVSLAGITAKRVYGGIAPVPAWFQQQYGVGPYVAGWGGGTSLIMNGGGASIGPTMYAFPEPSTVTAGTTFPTTGAGRFHTLMDYAPADSRRGVRVTVPQNYLDAPDYGGGPNPTSPPTVPVPPGGQWSTVRPDGKAWWTPCDSYWGGGMWIDTPTKHGFVNLFSAFGGKVYYMSSDVYCDFMQFEWHIFDPSTLGQVAQGAKTPWSAAPTYMAQVMLPGMGGYPRGHLTPGMAVTGATYDATTKRIYLLGSGINRFETTSRLFVFDIP